MVYGTAQLNSSRILFSHCSRNTDCTVLPCVISHGTDWLPYKMVWNIVFHSWVDVRRSFDRGSEDWQISRNVGHYMYHAHDVSLSLVHVALSRGGRRSGITHYYFRMRLCWVLTLGWSLAQTCAFHLPLSAIDRDHFVKTMLQTCTTAVAGTAVLPNCVSATTPTHVVSGTHRDGWLVKVTASTWDVLLIMQYDKRFAGADAQLPSLESTSKPHFPCWFHVTRVRTRLSEVWGLVVVVAVPSRCFV